jgi:dephospho-CoA kinase
MKNLGAAIIDADAIARACTATGGAAIDALQAHFGSQILTAEKALDRVKMRQLAFSDPIAKSQLESIVHPIVAQQIERQAQEADAIGATCIVFDIPLLVESHHWRSELDRVLVVDCSTHTQIARVAARNSLDHSVVEKIIAAQVNRSTRVRAADIVLANEGLTLEELAAQVREIGRQFGL